MAWREKNATIDALLERVVGILERKNEPAPNCGLSEFHKNKPSQFRGRFDPNGAQLWLEELEKIFEAMACSNEEKVAYATFMLAGEAEHWWRIARHQLGTEGIIADWQTFRRRFLEKYFPADLRRRKELEVLNLKQESMSVGEYAARFDELSRYCSYFMHADDRAQCSKFGSGLRLDIKQAIGYQQIMILCRDKRKEIRNGKKPYIHPNCQRGNNPSRVKQPNHGDSRQSELKFSIVEAFTSRENVAVILLPALNADNGKPKNDKGGSNKGEVWNVGRNIGGR
ncbi:uncharacterized protein LOC113874241 [Abrus precatorius]|uniref:Uncharacterized protein LOC113874241 n=1 Tax=Abrus precatorius TaxID=3816 RepID=A0A8B8MK41_ABRPR|nr:uncharacterized protein LOC113874241 [Abrus precatorius]